jgi:ferrous iron transport protein B
MARAAFIVDRLMHVMGLHGKSFLPLFLGFGCNVPAVMGARIIDSPRARLLTILVAPLVPCAGRMAVLAVLAPIFFGEYATLVSWALVGLNLSIIVLVGVFLHKVVLRSERGAFIMELPLYHMPNFRTIGLSIWQNLVAFLEKAGTIIILVSVVIWALSTFPHGNIETSYLAQLGRLLVPAGRLMGLGWKTMVALLTSFIAKENTIATLGVLYGAGKIHGDLSVIMGTVLAPAAALSFLAMQMLFIPCVATVAIIRQETASWRWTAFSVGLLLVISFAAGITIYQIAALVGWGM